MPKQIKSYRNFTDGLQTIRDIRDLKDSELATAINVMFDKRGAIRTMGSISEITSPTNLSPQTAGQVGGYGLAMLESDHETEPQTRSFTASSHFEDVGYFALRVGITSITSLGTGLAEVVTSAAHGLVQDDKITITGTVHNDYDNEVVFVVNTTTFRMTDYGATSEGAGGYVWLLLDEIYSAGQSLLISGTTLNNGLVTIKYISADGRHLYTDTALADEFDGAVTVKLLPQSEVLVLLSDATNGELDTYSKNNDAWTDGQASVDTTGGNLANSVRLQSYAIDGAIRICDAQFENANKIQWFGLINNTHFPGCTAEDIYFDWYAKDNDLAPPTDGAVGNTYPNDNAGFDFDIATPANSDSEWEAATYEIALSFIYDGNQESLLYTPTSNNTFTVADGDSVTISVHAHTNSTGYNPRITGGRLYCRISGSGDDWSLLCDIDMRLGARATLDGTYEAWTDGTTPATDIDTGTVTSLSLNLDTYESLNGYSHQVESNSISENGEGWKTAVVAGRRVFVANVRRYNQLTGANKTYPDRIYYSCVNKFDTFPTNQYLDVVKGDSESYVCLKSYADRLLAFKQNSLQIINIASGSDTDWYLEANEKYHGVYHPAAVCDTEFGIAWINKSGCFLYNGQQIENLIWDKIDSDDWKDFIGVAADDISIIGYDRHKKQLIVLKDCTGTQSDGGDVYIYDFFTKAWTTGTDIFTDTRIYTNFIHDWNGNLIVGECSSGVVTLKEWSSTSSSHSVTIETKDDDFGDLVHYKKIYKIYISAKELAGAGETITVKYSKDGANSFITADFNSTDTISANGEEVLVYSFTTPIQVQSLQLQITYTGNVLINDISVEYRTLYRRVS